MENFSLVSSFRVQHFKPGSINYVKHIWKLCVIIDVLGVLSLFMVLHLQKIQEMLMRTCQGL